MAETKKDPNEADASSSQISAETSLGKVGESPMPHGPDRPAPRVKSAKNPDSSSDESRRRQNLNHHRETKDGAQNWAGEAYERASDWARDTYEHASSWAGDTYDNGQHHARRIHRRSADALHDFSAGIRTYVSKNPLAAGMIGLAAGIAIGALLPRTRRENEAFGEWSDEAWDQGLRYAHEMAQRGQEYVKETLIGDSETDETDSSTARKPSHH